jgi:hypothetical protein
MPAHTGLMLLLLLLAWCSAAALGAEDDGARFSVAVQAGDWAAVQSMSTAAGFNASATITDRAGRRVQPIEGALNALQQYLALTAARGFNGRPPRAVGNTISSYLSVISLLAKHPTARLFASCPLRLAVHYRIFPAIVDIIDGSADRGLSCILQRDVHGRSLLHVAAASKAAGLSSLLNPSHQLHSAPAEQRWSYQLLMSTLRIQPPALQAPAAGSLLRAPDLPLMNSNLGAHELSIFIRSSFVSERHLSLRDSMGRTALHVAVAAAHVQAAATLLRAGASTDARDAYKRSALHLACSNRLHSIAELLLAHGADPDSQDFEGNTALHLAAANCDTATIEILIRHRASAKILNLHNESACFPATSSRSPNSRALRDLCSSSAVEHPHADSSTCCAATDAPEGDSWHSTAGSGGWGSATNDVPPLSLPCPLQVVHARSNLSAARFMSHFVSLQRPVIIKGLGTLTAAADRWSRQAFATRWGFLNVTVSDVPHAQSYGRKTHTMPLESFLKLHMGGASTGAYVFDSTVLRAHPDLRSDCPPPSILHHARTVLSQFFIGDSGTGSFPHFHSHALNMLVHGQKQWYVFPPPVAHFNVKSISRWLKDDWPLVAARGGAAGVGQCVQEAGDAVYVPQNWGHAVFNSAPSVGVAYEFDV